MNLSSEQSLWYKDAIFYQVYIRAFFDIDRREFVVVT